MTRAAGRAVMRCILASVALLALAGAVAQAQDHAATRPARVKLEGPEPRHILWVGNSFFYSNNSLHNHVDNLIHAADSAQQVQGVSVTISGAGLDWHDIASYLRLGAVERYWISDDNLVVVPAPRRFDTVVMMDCSLCPVHPQLRERFQGDVRRQVDLVVAAGARPVLFMSWAYADRPEMTTVLAEQYTQAGNANDALVAPAGLAFALARARRPDVQLYQPDRRHPSMLGTYLAACTVYAVLWGRSPLGNPYFAGIDAPTARFLQATAWDTARAYLDRQP